MCAVAYPSASIKGSVPGNKMAAVELERSGMGAEHWSASLVFLVGFSNNLRSVVSFAIFLQRDTAKYTLATLN